MPRMTLLALALLSGCAAPGGGYRDGETTIASAALFDPARFADVWHVVAAYGAQADCGPLAETWVPVAPGRFRVTGTACGPKGSRAFLAEARVTGPGRITMEGPGGRKEIWVLWVDGDYRVAALGSPSGEMGRIVARSPAPRPDLLAAAREALDFNGYDLAGLRGL